MIGRNIYVLDRGFVLVGVGEQDPDDFLFLRLTDCAIVRRWGTEHGLGQLAREGPQPNTVLDPEPDGVRLNKRFVLRSIPCNEEAWGHASRRNR